MAAKKGHSLTQMLSNVRESIQEKWEQLHGQVATAQQRKALRSEISGAIAGMGKTIKQYDPRRGKAKKTAAPKKRKPAAKVKAAAKSAAKKARTAARKARASVKKQSSPARKR